MFTEAIYVQLLAQTAAAKGSTLTRMWISAEWVWVADSAYWEYANKQDKESQWQESGSWGSWRDSGAWVSWNGWGHDPNSSSSDPNYDSSHRQSKRGLHDWWPGYGENQNYDAYGDAQFNDSSRTVMLSPKSIAVLLSPSAGEKRRHVQGQARDEVLLWGVRDSRKTKKRPKAKKATRKYSMPRRRVWKPKNS